MLRQRVVTTIVLLPVLIATIWFGELWFVLVVSAIGAIGTFEFYRLDTNGKLKPLYYLGILIVISLFLLPYFFNGVSAVHVLSIGIIISLLGLLLVRHRDHAFNQWAWAMAGILYPGFLITYWVKLRNMELGREYVFWLISILIINDVAAYFVGRALGKHALSPQISPHKTWEGAVGGLLAGIIISIAFYFTFLLPLSLWQIIVIGLLMCILAQAGDLIESLLKRNKAVKDSGKILPGHGGFLDRMDSYVLTAAAAYYIISLISH